MATPQPPRRLDLAMLKQALVIDGYTIHLDARVLLLVRKDVESTIYSTGKVLLKTTRRAEAEAAYEDLRPHLEAAQQ